MTCENSIGGYAMVKQVAVLLGSVNADNQRIEKFANNKAAEGMVRVDRKVKNAFDMFIRENCGTNFLGLGKNLLF